MKKCKNCGALQSDDRSVCLDCGTILGRPMTEAEEEAAEDALDDKLDAMSERTEDFHVPLRDKIMGALCIVGIIAAFVLIGLSVNAKDAIRDALPDNVLTGSDRVIVTGFSNGNGTAAVFPESSKEYRYYFQRMDTLDQASAFGIVGIISLIFAFPMLLFPRFIWNLSTLKYRLFYEWETTPSDFALIAQKAATYILFAVGIGAVLWGWFFYL